MITKLILTGLLLTGMFANAHAGTEATDKNTPVISIKASRFVYSPSQLKLKKGETVILEIEATDRQHGFAIPDLGVRADINPGEKTTIKITPGKSGTFIFYCDIFCGSGHEQMAGELIIVD